MCTLISTRDTQRIFILLNFSSLCRSSVSLAFLSSLSLPVSYILNFLVILLLLSILDHDISVPGSNLFKTATILLFNVCCIGFFSFTSLGICYNLKVKTFKQTSSVAFLGFDDLDFIAFIELYKYWCFT